MRFNPLFAAVAGIFAIAAIPSLVSDRQDGSPGASRKTENAHSFAAHLKPGALVSDSANDQARSSLSQRDQPYQSTENEAESSSFALTNWLQALSAIAVAVFTFFLWRLQSQQVGLTAKALKEAADATVAMVDANRIAKQAADDADSSARFQILAANRAADAAHDANRPWIELIPPTNIEMLFSASGVELTADVSFTNHGNSPATNVLTRAELIAVAVSESGVGDSKNPRYAKEKVVVRAGIETTLDRWEETHSASGQIAYPGKPEMAIIDPVLRIDAIRAAEGCPAEPIFFFLAVGCSYRFSGKKGRTVKAYLLIIQRHPEIEVAPYSIAENLTLSIGGQHIQLADTLEGYAR